MFSKLYVYGDSFVHGHDVDQDLTWANKLGQELNMEVFNRGVAGGSNKLSVINLLNDLVELEDIKETLVIFAWTSYSRSCIYLEEDNKWHNILVGHQTVFKELKIVEESYYKYIYKDFDALYKLYSQKILVQSFLKQLGIRYFFVNSFTDNHELIVDDRLKNLFKLEKFIEKEKYLIGYNNSIYNEVCNKYGLLGKDGFHPCKEGHQLAMQLIKDELERIL